MGLIEIVLTLVSAVVVLGIVIVVVFFVCARKNKSDKTQKQSNITKVEKLAKAQSKTVDEPKVEVDEVSSDNDTTLSVAAKQSAVAAPSIVVTSNETATVADEPAVEPPKEVVSERPRKFVAKYSRSFQSKVIQSSDETKKYYSEIKNRLNAYDVKSRMSWKWETFRRGRKTLVKIRLRGKTLSVAFALDPAAYDGTKYRVESVADITSLADTPCLFKIKSERRVKYAKDLIKTLMQNNGLTENATVDTVDYVAQYPFETTEALLKRKLIKELKTKNAPSVEVFKPTARKSVQAQDVDKILKDEVAAALIEQSDKASDKTKTGIINIDTLSQNFTDGETVTIAEIRKRIPGYRKITYIKVLARGTLDKRLTVEADVFSLQAVKMIVLMGGKALKKR